MSKHDSPKLQDTDHETEHCAGSAEAARPAIQQAGGGANPTPALHDLRVVPLSHRFAKRIFERNHYLHSMPGGTELCFGVIADDKLMGAIAFGAGPANAFRLVKDAQRDECLTLSRLWLNDELPANSASRVIGVGLRTIRRATGTKFIVTYADPGQGHLGGIYQGSNWLYTGLSDASPLLDLGDGIARHSRSVSNSLGTHSIRFLAQQGFDVRQVPRERKHRYIYFIDPSWRAKLNCQVLPYPRREDSSCATD